MSEPKGRNVLVIAAHPDDEVLGCGGTMARHAREGDAVHVLIMAEGVTSRDRKRDAAAHASDLSELARAARRANEILGVASLTLEGLPDNRMDSLDLLDVVKLVEQAIATVKPDIVYSHHAGDVNVDHRQIHHAVVTACRPLPGTSVKTLAFFEVPSSTEWQIPGSAPVFAPNWFVDISRTLDHKLRALEAYASEMREFPHPRSMKGVSALAGWRGVTAGVEAAEAFILGRALR